MLLFAGLRRPDLSGVPCPVLDSQFCDPVPRRGYTPDRPRLCFRVPIAQTDALIFNVGVTCEMTTYASPLSCHRGIAP